MWDGIRARVAKSVFCSPSPSITIYALSIVYSAGCAAMTSKAEAFRRNAEEARQRAEQATSSFDRDHWLEMAQHWLKMAAAEEAAATDR
jgi:hypothetical protein